MWYIKCVEKGQIVTARSIHIFSFKLISRTLPEGLAHLKFVFYNPMDTVPLETKLSFVFLTNLEGVDASLKKWAPIYPHTYLRKKRYRIVSHQNYLSKLSIEESYHCCFAIPPFTCAVVTFQESVIAVSLLAVVCPVGRFPATEKLKESLLASCAVIDILADVLTVTFTSNGPTKIFGGKFSA